MELGPSEIASTPENSPLRQGSSANLRLPTEHTGINNVSDGAKSDAESSTVDGSENRDDIGPLGRPPSPTLSSPTRTISNTQASPHRETQAIFEDPTPFVDLDVPPPDEGWDDEELSFFEPDPNTQLIDSPPLPPSSPHINVIPETQPNTLGTQSLRDSGTQIPDFSLAEPDGGWDTLDLIPPMSSSPPSMADEHSSPVPVPRARSPTPAPGLLQDTIESFCDQHVLAGYAFDDCMASMKATCLDLPLAESVLRYMTRKGKGRIPRSERGIWTKDDDDDLLAKDARRVARVYEKHGEGSGEKRWEFLDLWKGTGL